jgi:hypothetical protein
MSGDGVLMMSVDNLPAELPSEASAFFGSQLLPYIQYYLTVRKKDRLGLARAIAPLSKLFLALSHHSVEHLLALSRHSLLFL